MINAINSSVYTQLKASGTSELETKALSGQHSDDQEKLKEVCRDFESLFVKQMLDAMRKTVQKSSLMGKGSGQDYFEDKLYEEYANKMTETARLGIADMMYKQLSVNISSSDAAKAYDLS